MLKGSLYPQKKVKGIMNKLYHINCTYLSLQYELWYPPATGIPKQWKNNQNYVLCFCFYQLR